MTFFEFLKEYLLKKYLEFFKESNIQENAEKNLFKNTSALFLVQNCFPDYVFFIVIRHL